MAEGERQILGIRFYVGGIEGLLDRVAQGGLIVVPSASVLVDLARDPSHREALEGSDLAITDSGFMVLLWLLLRHERLARISGLRLMRELLERPDFRANGAAFWVMPSEADSKANRGWLKGRGIHLTGTSCPVAPMYGPGRLADPALLAAIEAARPRYVVLCIAGGVQERLGFYLRKNLSYRPAILCTGAAIAFLTGRQTAIPVWADRMMLGWLFRIAGNPARFAPRFARALRLAPMLWKFGEKSVATG